MVYFPPFKNECNEVNAVKSTSQIRNYIMSIHAAVEPQPKGPYCKGVSRKVVEQIRAEAQIRNGSLRSLDQVMKVAAGVLATASVTSVVALYAWLGGLLYPFAEVAGLLLLFLLIIPLLASSGKI